MTNINYLRIPLSKLNYIDDLASFGGLNKDELVSLRIEYSEKELKEIIVAARWAKNNPNHDFRTMLPNLKFTNLEIYRYLTVILGQLETINGSEKSV